jgi:hypothetical protein
VSAHIVAISGSSGKLMGRIKWEFYARLIRALPIIFERVANVL